MNDQQQADNTKLYVGNLPYTVTSDEMRNIFSEYGEIEDAVVIFDRDTNRSKGFGFVKFKDEKSAQAAIDGKNNQTVGDRKIFVNVARPMAPRDNSFRGGSDRGGRYSR